VAFSSALTKSVLLSEKHHAVGHGSRFNGVFQAVGVGIDNAYLTGIAMGNVHFVARRVVDGGNGVRRGTR
jgi:hypothetical protein